MRSLRVKRGRLARRLGVLAVTLLGACAQGEPVGQLEPKESVGPTLAAGPGPMPPHARLVVVTDLEGTLEPCGCTSRPAFGIDRLAAAIAELRGQGVPMLLLGAGNFMGDPRATGTRPGRRVQDELMQDGLSSVLAALAFDALAPGPSDLTDRKVQLARLVREGQMTLLSDAVVPELESLRTSVLRRLGPLKIGLLGAGSKLPGLAAGDPSAGRREVLRLRTLGAKLVLAFAHGASDLAALGLAEAGVDLVINTGLGEAAPGPTQAGSALMLAGGRRGEGLWVVDLWLTPGPSAAWTLVQAPPLRLEPGLRAARVGYRVLDRDAPSDPDVRALLDQLFARTRAANARAGLPSQPPQKGDAHYVGSRTCAACHTQAYFWWRGTQHGRAFETLIARGRELDLDCIGCHVTGFARPGGANSGSLAELKGVGCESCHGPGSKHVDNPHTTQGDVTRTVAEPVCTECHDADHSDTFVYSRAHARMRAPGHAAP